MKRELAQELLSATMEWTPREVEEYRELIEDLSELKFDSYQQYRPGSRFVENLTIWLNKFKTKAERQIVLDFILENIIYISPDEMNHLINMVFPHIIEPIIKEEIRDIITKEEKTGDKACYQKLFKLLTRQSLFFGLSDGARIDFFRRSNPLLSNEQICISYEIPDAKIEEIRNEMKKDTGGIAEGYNFKYYNIETIQNIFLFDDFSGSGISYLRKEGEVWKGKISKLFDQLENVNIPYKNIPIYLILYLITPKALEGINSNLLKYSREKDTNLEIKFVQMVNPLSLKNEVEEIFKKYYNNSIETTHYLKGNHGKPYLGFDECSLPLVIYHNTPNNSFPIIWDDYFTGLFPRITRHKDVI